MSKSVTLPKHIEDRLRDVLEVEVTYPQTSRGTQEEQKVYYDPKTVDIFKRILSILYSVHNIPDPMIGAAPDGSCLILQWKHIAFTLEEDGSALLYNAAAKAAWKWDVCVDLNSVARTISYVLDGKT
jgi:hypothetical protein